MRLVYKTAFTEGLGWSTGLALSCVWQPYCGVSSAWTSDFEYSKYGGWFWSLSFSENQPESSGRFLAEHPNWLGDF